MFEFAVIFVTVTAIMAEINSTITFSLASAGVVLCQNPMECINMPGYTCKNSRCVCDPDHDTGLFSCRADAHGEKCRTDLDCIIKDSNLVCAPRSSTCRCRRGLIWDTELKKCYLDEDDTYIGKFDPVRDLIIPGIVVMIIGAMVYLGMKLFCNCGKMWRRRRRGGAAEDTPQQATWVASYRVYSSVNNMDARSPPSSTPFPIPSGPCMGLFLPGTSIATATALPPPYEEALKHKVILSSYPTGATVMLPSTSQSPSASINIDENCV